MTGRLLTIALGVALGNHIRAARSRRLVDIGYKDGHHTGQTTGYHQGVRDAEARFMGAGLPPSAGMRGILNTGPHVLHQGEAVASVVDVSPRDRQPAFGAPPHEASPLARVEPGPWTCFGPGGRSHPRYVNRPGERCGCCGRLGPQHRPSTPDTP